MELPDDILSIIREFSRPQTRADWRTCKMNVSVIIQKFSRETISWFERLYETRPELHIMAPGCYQKRYLWTLYQRILMMKRLIRI
jgi:hypothetical protein